jgi:demethylmenaquinone methyltransferase / 2-methoxy-6-polyprenyl-1,4-benzoquinol methylase
MTERTELLARKPEEIRRMFAAISRGYDRFNTVNSFGLHHAWRKELVAWSGATPASRVLDCATGTGDVAFAFERRGVRQVIGVDFCPEMLEIARRKKRAGSGIEFRVADLLSLPFEGNSFDVVSIAFGVRNVSDVSGAVAEMVRVTKPGGRVMVLETGRPDNRLISKCADLYCRIYVSGVSGWMTGHRWAYRYLEDSTAEFDSGGAFLSACQEEKQISKIETRRLTLGFNRLYRLTKV